MEKIGRNVNKNLYNINFPGVLEAACVLASHRVCDVCAAITAGRVWTGITGTAASVPVDSQGRTVASVSD